MVEFQQTQAQPQVYGQRGRSRQLFSGYRATLIQYRTCMLVRAVVRTKALLSLLLPISADLLRRSGYLGSDIHAAVAVRGNVVRSKWRGADAACELLGFSAPRHPLFLETLAAGKDVLSNVIATSSAQHLHSSSSPHLSMHPTYVYPAVARMTATPADGRVVHHVCHLRAFLHLAA